MRRRLLLAPAGLLLTVATACTTPVPISGSTTTTAPVKTAAPMTAAPTTAAPTSTTASTTTTTTTPSSTVDPTALPIGDGKYTTAGPTKGYIYSCQSTFNGGGASATGSWFNADTGTWDSTTKPEVDGEVIWPNATFTVTLDGTVRRVTGNDLPINDTTGVYPIQPSDDAYQYDRNPNSIKAQTVSYNLPATPQLAASASCTGMGPIGVMLSGPYFFNALDAGGRDAGAHEILDRCDGHPERSGAYHYHSLSSCSADSTGPTEHSALAGYALDGFGIYGIKGENGQQLGTADLDECHGHTHTITWDGQQVSMYHYHATMDYPYTIGCYRGTPVR
ncbi:MAG: YHYH protein [Actinobacteria bacterium]|nr:YHYH protein [Actinomycetota bacterium]